VDDVNAVLAAALTPEADGGAQSGNGVQPEASAETVVEAAAEDNG
jgi:hypothetical protein